MTQQEWAIRQMNDWGGKGRPFFFLIDFDQLKPVVLPLEETAAAGIQFSMSNGLFSKTEPSVPVTLEYDRYPFDSYAAQFNNVMDHLRAGDSFLVNLTCQTPVRLNLGFSQVYTIVRAKYKLLYKDHFLVFSPETFVQIQDGVITSCPMKGTLDASIPNALQMLTENPKEKAEHSTIVDLIRNDLSIVATNVQVKRFRYI